MYNQQIIILSSSTGSISLSLWYRSCKLWLYACVICQISAHYLSNDEHYAVYESQPTIICEGGKRGTFQVFSPEWNKIAGNGNGGDDGDDDDDGDGDDDGDDCEGKVHCWCYNTEMILLTLMHTACKDHQSQKNQIYWTSIDQKKKEMD